MLTPIVNTIKPFSLSLMKWPSKEKILSSQTILTKYNIYGDPTPVVSGYTHKEYTRLVRLSGTSAQA